MSRESPPPSFEFLFDAYRPTLWRIGYRLTGSAADADDVVQETFVRALARRKPVGDPHWRPWLIRVASNLGLDELRRRRRRKYAGAWLPSPLDTPPLEETLVDPTPDPARSLEQSTSASFAFLVALEALSPKQRAVVVLREVADYSVREVGDALRMSDENVRLTHHRARRVLRDVDADPRPPAADRREATRLALANLMFCLRNHDVAGLESLLSTSVRLVTDGGGEFNALRRPMIGRAPVMHLLLTISRRRGPGSRVDVRTLNGMPALRIVYATARDRQAPRAALLCALDATGRIGRLDAVLATRKLTAVRFDM